MSRNRRRRTYGINSHMFNEHRSSYQKLNSHEQLFKTQRKLTVLLYIIEATRRSGVLTVISSKASTSGFPKNSIVNYVAGEDGKPIFSLSNLSSHTPDLRADRRASLLASDNTDLVTLSKPNFRISLFWNVC